MASYRKKKNGKWEVQVRKKGYGQKCKTFISKEDAKRWAKEIESQMDKQIFEDYDRAIKTKLSDLIVKYRDEVVSTHKAVRQTTSKLNTLLNFKICKLSLMQIKPHNVYEFKKELVQLNKSPKTINIYISLLKGVWKSAKGDWGIVLPPQNPFAFIKQERVNNIRDEILTDEQYKTLLECCSRSKLNILKDIVQFAYVTGARINEILSLRRSNTDLKKQTAKFIDTKNGENRSIPLTSLAVEILKKYPFGERFFNSNYHQVSHSFDLARKEAGLKNFRFHDLRACFCTNALLSGMSVAEVSSISGHKDWSQLKRYTRIKAENLIEKVENISPIQSYKI